MKKLLTLLLAIPLLASFTACNDDDDQMPKVQFTIEYANASNVDGTVYILKDSSLTVSALNVKAVNPNHNAALGPVEYYVNNVPVGMTPVQPFAITIPAGFFNLGTNTLGMAMNVAEEGCSLARGYIEVKVEVVADSTAIPTPSPVNPEAPVPYTLH